jgi:hypothetical protein
VVEFDLTLVEIARRNPQNKCTTTNLHQYGCCHGLVKIAIIESSPVPVRAWTSNPDLFLAVACGGVQLDKAAQAADGHRASAEYPQVDIMYLWYKYVNCGAENCAPELKWGLEKVSVDRDETLFAVSGGGVRPGKAAQAADGDRASQSSLPPTPHTPNPKP